MTSISKKVLLKDVAMHRQRFHVSPILYFIFCILSFMVSSCSKNEDYDPYTNWEARNVTWFQQVADTARTAINAARAQYGSEWEGHCDWRMYKSLRKSPSFQSGLLEDSICVKILKRGTGTKCPLVTDIVEVAYRGWQIPAVDSNGNVFEKVFDQTFYGTYDVETAASTTNDVSEFTEGFGTALQYMKEGDDWMVYIPSSLLYAEQVVGELPAFSSARFRIIMIKVY